MKSRLPLIFLFLALLGVSWLLLHEPAEPSYQGKTLSQWLDEDRAHSDEPSQAIRAMGVKSVPFLLDMLEVHDWPLKLKFYEWTKSPRLDQSRRAMTVQHYQASYGFKVLGPIAKPAIPQLAEFLANSREPRFEAYALHFIGPDAIGVLTNALTSPKASVREAAAAALGNYAKDSDATQGKVAAQIIPVLIGRAHDPDGMARSSACVSLMSFEKAPEIAVPLLVPLVADKDKNARFFALLALPSFASGAKSAVPALFNALHDPDQEIRENAIDALACIIPEDPAVAAVLMQNLRDAHYPFRMHTIIVLGSVGPRAQSFVPDLLKLLEDEDASIRAVTIIALCGISPQNPDVLAAIINCFGDRNPGVRSSAAYAAGKTQTSAQPVISGLIKLIDDDPDYHVHLSAIQALMQIDPGNPAGMPNLVRDLLDPDPARRDSATTAFYDVSSHPAAKTAVPELLNLIQDRTGNISFAAAFALTEIDSKNTAPVDPLIKALQDPTPRYGNSRPKASATSANPPALPFHSC